jgi:hypothetical protein
MPKKRKTHIDMRELSDIYKKFKDALVKVQHEVIGSASLVSLSALMAELGYGGLTSSAYTAVAGAVISLAGLFGYEVILIGKNYYLKKKRAYLAHIRHQ